ncbi:MAG: uroporphyrinogen-III C-methyltransferase [Merismopedia sp. SIO2A8]|nr:uroporphyrinogen-III C-methyltransferase [Merismopedia sp. SIO2A8]
MANDKGVVYLMGAGPGDISHLTVEAQTILQTATDVLIYDALVDEQLRALLPQDCQHIHVGKRGGQPSTPQADINHLLVHHCQQGRRVVRLKSGDPFIFGRCAAEITALKQAQCDFVVVPGLSSALAAPLLAHIPLTDPVLSRSFTVLSAHEPDVLNWPALAQLDTLVILMGTRHLATIVEQLQNHGRSPRTPIAIIRWASQPQEQIWVGTLESIVQQTSRQTLSPAVMVVGEVVSLRPYLSKADES